MVPAEIGVLAPSRVEGSTGGSTGSRGVGPTLGLPTANPPRFSFWQIPDKTHMDLQHIFYCLELGDTDRQKIDVLDA